MPRHPDPDLEDRILNAAQKLWKHGGEKSLTMRAVAREAGTNTPAVYRRFKNRGDLVRGLLLRTQQNLRALFEKTKTLEEMADAYMEFGLRHPHEYELFYVHSQELFPPKGKNRSRPLRELRPNFSLLEQRLAERLGGSPEDHATLALGIWATVHGATTMLLWQAIPQEHEGELRRACRASVAALLGAADQFLIRK